jgi:hypothetical protein
MMGGQGQGHSHFARGGVTNKPHWIQVFLSSAPTNQQRFTHEIPSALGAQ